MAEGGTEITECKEIEAQNTQNERYTERTVPKEIEGQNEANSRNPMENESVQDESFEENARKWDVYDEKALEYDDALYDKTIFTSLVKLLKVVVYLATFCIVLSCGVLSKGSLLFMTSAIGRKRTFPVCKDFPGYIDDQHEIEMSTKEKLHWLWCLLFALFIPEILTFIRSSRLCIFKKYEKPNLSSFLMVFIVESMQTTGMCLLIFWVFPEMHVMRALSLTNAVCFVPCLLNLYSSWRSYYSSYDIFKNFLNVIAFLLQGSIFIWLTVVVINRPKEYMDIIGTISVILISCSWWENFVGPNSFRCLIRLKEDIEKSRNFIYIFITVWKIVLTFGWCLLYVYCIGEEVPEFFKMNDIFRSHNITLTLPTTEMYSIPSVIKLEDKEILDSVKSIYLIPVTVLIIQVFSSFLCYSCCKFVCKVCMQQFSFSLPLCLVVPVTMTLLNYACKLKNQSSCAFYELSPYIYWRCPRENESFNYFFANEIGFIWILWFTSQLIVTIHTWFPKNERMASTNKLFVLPMYSAVLVDQFLVLNRRKDEKEDPGKKGQILEEQINDTPDNVTRIFACATMWHETPDEMEQLLKSIMRMDVHQCSQATIQEGFEIKNPDYYELQVHIFFDDAFVISDEDDDKRTINSFVKDFIAAVDMASSKVYKKCTRPDPPFKVPTPYGGQLVWKLKGENFLIVHLKDKELIRHKKRWSQVMYMYYLLGYGLEDKMCEGFTYKVAKDNLRKNTFILALDGDIDFKPSAVQLLVDLMKRNRNLGAACGRIHPVGTGLMVYYQKFEYAIGHWLQKSTEHMIGCVLCSPGCFSLFRAEALLKKNTIRTYSTIAREAVEYVQFDQGEDRWLCTLLLQRGYRVEYSAASDAYTHCPETFAEFYTQRRRWAPSTMANIMDLLINYQKTVECNDNISRPYVAYQVLLMVGTILGPGTIFLMLVGAMVSAFGISNWHALAANTVPVVAFIIICFHAKNDTQIFVAQIISALYALLMMAVLVGISLQLVIDGITSPSGIFILSMTASFVVAALAHPQEFWCVAHGIIYFLSIPSMYLFLALYSFINLHVVSWGTREVQTKKSKKQLEAERLQTQIASQPKNKSGMFDWINALSARENESEEEGSISFSFANLFRCMCCTYPKPDPTSLQMVKIEMALDKINNQIKSIQNQMDSTVVRVPGMRRRSSVHILKKDLNLNPLAEAGDNEEDEEISDDQQSDQEEHTYNQVDNDLEYWLSDPSLKKSPIKRLTNQEKEFWRQLIDTYLYPLADNPEEKAKVSRQLIELRNKVMFGVMMLNALFILIVFLLQRNKDILHIEWPLGGQTKNITYIFTLNEIRIDMEYLQLEPINLVLVFFFTLIVAIQFVGMLFHRLETLSHILASTNLFVLQSKGIDEINFPKLTDLLQKQGLKDDDEIELLDENEATELTPLSEQDGIPQIFSPAPPSEDNAPVKKFRSLSLAMEQDLLKIVNKDPKFAQAVRKKSTNPNALEALRIRASLNRLGVNTPQSITRPPTPAGSSVLDLERLDWQWSHQGSFRRSRLLEPVLDNSDSESVESIQVISVPSTLQQIPTINITNGDSEIPSTSHRIPLRRQKSNNC